MKFLLCAALLMVFATRAQAFEVESPVSNGCHEELTLASARAAGFPVFAEAPVPTEDQRRAMNDLVFALPRRDPWSLALFIGVRSNDLRDFAPTHVAGLFHVHDDPAGQPEHCIRRQEDDGPAGDATALLACRDFIIGELEAGGLLEDTLDTALTEPVSSYFRFRGQYVIALPRFAYRLGRAVHALQDAYTHSMRDASTGAVRHVLNWIDAFGQNDYTEADDGYPHLSTLDDCRRTDTHQRLRIERATAATTSVLAAIADRSSGRRARVTAAVEAALVLMPNCTAANRYCDAPELDEPTDIRTFGCSTTEGGSLGFGAGLVVVAGALLLGRRRRAALASAGLAILLVSWSPEVQAQAPAAEPEQAGPEAEALTERDASDRWHSNHWHFDARVGGAADNGALAGMVGIGRTHERWNFGFLAEWNPWFSLDRISARVGVFNAYGTVSYRWFQGHRVSIATRIEAGSSTMLFELLGLDKYTTGIYFGGALATIRLPVTPKVAVTFDPVHFALPTPRPFGLPFYYKQYRVSVGIEVRL